MSTPRDRLNNNETLGNGEHLVAPNGAYFLVMQTDGNLVGYTSCDFKPINAFWSSKTNGKGTGPYRCVMQDDGNLVVYDTHNQALWASNTMNKGAKPHSLVVQSDRNVVVYDGNRRPTWASNTNI